MNKGAGVVYEFGDFRLDPALRILLHNGEPVTVWPKVFDTLLLLLQSGGRIVEKEELMQTLWPESFVEESNLTQNVFILRRILNDDRNGHSFIQTVHRRGYKFVASVRELEPSIIDNALSAGYWRGRSPFRGLQVFETEDAWLFFGRETETDELLAHLRRSPVLSVVGNSGSGKSSLIRAGLIPALEQGRFCPTGSPNQQWRIAVFRPSVAPLDYLAEVLPGQLIPELSLQERADFIRDCRAKLSAYVNGLRDVIAALAGTILEQAGPTRILLVADQFEEIFTLTNKRVERDRYIDALLTASRTDGPCPVHLVFALRADFYADCLEHAELGRAMAANQYNVGRMSHEQLRESIEKRLQLASGQAEAGLIDSLLEDVGLEPGNLALLEHALGQLWEKCGGFGCTLTNQAYAEIGRLRGALGRHADEIYAGLRDEEKKHLAKRIFLELVHVGDGAQDTRRRIPKADLHSLGNAEEVEGLLADLASSRLISTGEEDHESFVEVSHEALIREWPLLREWLTQNREDLRLERRLLQSAEEWNSLNRDRGALLQGARLAQAEEWLGRHAGVSSLLRGFVQASRAAREEAQERELAQEKTKAVRLRWFSIAVSFMLLLAIAAAWFTYREKTIEKSRAMAAQSGEMLSRDHGQALDLAIRSWETARTEEARLAVSKAVSQPLAVLKHDGPVMSAFFSPDGRYVVSASYDHTACVWDAADGHLLFTLRGHTDKLHYATFSPNGQQIVTVSDDHTARVWSSIDGHLLFVLIGHSDKVWGAWFSPDGKRLATSSDDKTARIWDAGDGRLLLTLQAHSNTLGSAQFSPDGLLIVTTSWDHTARVWNAIDGRMLMIFEHSSEVLNAAFSPDSKRIVTGTFDGTLHVWSSISGKHLFNIQHGGRISGVVYSRDGQRIISVSHNSFGLSVWNAADGHLLFNMAGNPSDDVALSPDGSRIVTAGLDHIARIWNSTDGHLLATLEGHSGALRNAAFSPDGQRVITASEDQTARIWSTMSARSLATLEAHTNYISYVTFSGDGRRILTASWDNSARVWSGTDGRPLVVLQGHTDKINMAQFSPDGRRVVTTSHDDTARIWNSGDGRLLAIVRHSALTWGAQFSPDGRSFVTASYDHMARVWNTADGSLLAVLKGHTDAVTNAQFSPDGQHILTASNDHTARIWNAADGQLLFTLQGHTERVTTARFSPDGQRIVTTSNDHTARVWNSADGRLIATLQGHADKIVSARFSPDSQRIVTASFDNTARLWDAATGWLLLTLQGHKDVVATAQFSPDGQRILTTSQDSTARLWSVADGRLLVILHGHTNPIYSAEFSPDGQRIVTGSLDSTARVWQIITLDDVSRILAH